MKRYPEPERVVRQEKDTGLRGRDAARGDGAPGFVEGVFEYGGGVVLVVEGEEEEG